MKHYPPRPTGAGTHNGWSRNRDSAAHQRWARAIRKRDRVCQHCGNDRELQAHHLRPGYQLEDGVLLCRPCHKAVDSHAR